MYNKYATMGFDAGSAINSIAEWFYNAPLVRGIVSNSMITALLLTAMVIVVVLYFYHSEMRGQGKKKMIRMGIVLLVMVTGVVFIHHYAMLRVMNDELKQKGIYDVFTGVTQSQLINPSTVTPTTVTGAHDDDDDDDDDEPPKEQPAQTRDAESQGKAPASKTPKTFSRPDNVKIEIEDIDLGM